MASQGDSRILLVEDNLTNQKVALLMLKKLGHEADLAQNGLVACQAFASKPYELILMDCLMPEMDGFEATRSIRTSGEFGRTVPIVALTANAFTEDREKCLAAGMSDYLSKPFTMEQIGAKVERWLTSGPAKEASQTAASPEAAPRAVSAAAGTGSAPQARYAPGSLGSFLADTPALLLRLSQAIERSDKEQFHDQVRSVREAAGGFGLEVVALAASRLESSFDRGQLDRCQEELKQLRWVLDQVQVRAGVALPQ